MSHWCIQRGMGSGALINILMINMMIVATVFVLYLYYLNMQYCVHILYAYLHIVLDIKM